MGLKVGPSLVAVSKFLFFFKGPSFIRSWKFGMFSDSESTGGSSESRSLDSESISPGTVTTYLGVTKTSVKD